MSTGNENLDLLIKLLSQTTNDNDNVALMAIRAANKQVLKFRTNWEDLLRGRVTIVSDPFAALSKPGSHSARTTRAPAASPPHRAPEPTPTPPPRPRPAAPQPQPRPTNAQGSPNRFRARCYKCGKTLDAYQGVLSDKSPITGNWRVECQPGQCLPSYQKPKGKAAKSSDNLTILL